MAQKCSGDGLRASPGHLGCPDLTYVGNSQKGGGPNISCDFFGGVSKGGFCEGGKSQ